MAAAPKPSNAEKKNETQRSGNAHPTLGQRLKSFVKGTAAYRYFFFSFYLVEKVLAKRRRKGFAEHGEDLKVEELLGEVRFFIDIGAYDGMHSSNTFYWALRGAHGVCFEPVPEIFANLKSLYRFSRGVVCKNSGISDKNEEVEMVALDQLSYIPETRDLEHQQMFKGWHARPLDVRTIKLQTFCDAVQDIPLPESIDLLSIDVEGHELNVLKSIPFQTLQFKIIILETHLLDAGNRFIWKHRDVDEIENLLSKHGYRPIFKSVVNTFFACEGS